MSTRDLFSFQEDFLHALINEDHSKELLVDIIPGGEVKTGEAALEIHRNGYFARLTEALGETYEAVWSVVGDEAFFDLCHEYIDYNTSSKYSLLDYGENFPNFLTDSNLTTDFPFLCDLSKFSREFKNLFHKEQHVSIDLNDLVTAFI